VGIGGHALHGGFGVSSNTKGLTLDWLVGATVVLANSTIVNCSKSENSELFWGLRGAGGSLGIVTSFTFKTFRVPSELTYFVASVRWSQQKAVAGVKALQAFALDGMSAELNMRLFVTRSFSNLEGLYYGNQADLESVLNPLLTSIGGTMSQIQTGSWLDQLNHFGDGMALNQSYPYDLVSVFARELPPIVVQECMLT
jgi:FAD/FMN-containing dehydrogenase